MSSMNFYNQNGESLGQIEVSSSVYETSINEEILHQVVLMQLSNKRRGTASTKGRSEVRGSGRKIYRQKGTGMARAGTRRSPIRIGGGVAFGPKPRDFSYSVPKKIRRLAVKSALADKFQNDCVIVVDSISLDNPKTRDFAAIMDKLGLSKDEKNLFVLGDLNRNVYYSIRNIPRANVCVWDGLNTYDILWHDKVIFTQEALKKVEERYWEIEAEAGILEETAEEISEELPEQESEESSEDIITPEETGEEDTTDEL
ncbi:50S ribosomal protein L4 [Candidatus Poribacteria bacterium]|nr:50S ribosomal protein L4 [Candidatus Poribacteria bacterium]